jgi:nicotinate-nucleotide adenylyltransferase
VAIQNKKIGILGGSFDPPHLGHLSIAQDAFEHLELDAVWFVPTYLSPHKSSSHLSSEVRAELVERMVSADGRFECNRVEVEAEKQMYAIDTVNALIEKNPNVSFYWIIGADQIARLSSWKSFEQLSRKIIWALLERPGSSAELSSQLKEIDIQRVPTHQMDISSTEIRKRILHGLAVYMFLHPAVEEYIAKHNLYRSIDSLQNA